MNVLSLFDGISCGRVALERANIKVNKYYASEIDKYAIQVSDNNYPSIIRLGDINNWESWDIDWASIDLILAGSPCQGFSFAGKQLAFNDKRSALFFRFAEILENIKSLNSNVKFLLENVRMKKEFERVITSVVGVEPIMINSNLVSFQNRERLYWTNIPDISIPEDKNISFQDYKDTNFDYCSQFKVNQTASRLKMWGEGVRGNCPNVTNRNKVNCITLKQDRHKNSGLIEFDGFCRYLTRRELELSQTLDIGYTDGVSYGQACKTIGNAWTVDVIAHILSSME
ncbi:DNA cytosine methyltransferase [Orbus sturtevantii]|uniref:DNA cytosine methyltransferase n=1 Tax=Orbus sturtevantii TaxID=3074109 RepID=UPI00370DC626